MMMWMIIYINVGRKKRKIGHYYIIGFHIRKGSEEIEIDEFPFTKFEEMEFLFRNKIYSSFLHYHLRTRSCSIGTKGREVGNE
jgi:hypothetical protein